MSRLGLVGARSPDPCWGTVSRPCPGRDRRSPRVYSDLRSSQCRGRETAAQPGTTTVERNDSLGEFMMLETAPLLTATNLHKAYRRNAINVEVLRGLDLDVFPGEFLSIVGASGS